MSPEQPFPELSVCLAALPARTIAALYLAGQVVRDCEWPPDEAETADLALHSQKLADALLGALQRPSLHQDDALLLRAFMAGRALWNGAELYLPDRKGGPHLSYALDLDRDGCPVLTDALRAELLRREREPLASQQKPQGGPLPPGADLPF